MCICGHVNLASNSFWTHVYVKVVAFVELQGESWEVDKHWYVCMEVQLNEDW